MKKLFFVLLFALIGFSSRSFAQAPEKLSYQAIIRNAGNGLVSSQAVGMRISILQGSASGSVVYAETQQSSTNASGLVTLEIGSGTVVSGSFASINWTSGPYFIKTETDPEGGSNYSLTGTSQLLSVPYALYAKTSGSSTPGPQGPAGSNGKNALIRTTPEAAGANCANGGVKIETGLDADGNGQLADTEVNVSQTKYLCNGVGNISGTANNQILFWNGNSWVALNPGNNGNILTICGDSLVWTENGFCSSNFPIITTNPISSLTSVSAISGGIVSSDGGSNILKRGVCWSTFPNPTIALMSKTEDGTGLGSFTSTISNIYPNTLYYLRSYATNGNGTSYGNQVTFTTQGVSGNLATISTSNVEIIGCCEINCGGNISADGGLVVTNRGVCWAIGTTPTIANSKTDDGSGGGSFSSKISDLLPNKTYFVRSYATNEAGTSYGLTYSFQTQPSGPNVSDIDGNNYESVKIGNQFWMKQNLKVKRYRNGDNILTNQTDAQWAIMNSGAFSFYNNDTANNSRFGKLYNWYAVADPRGICP